MYYLEPGNPYRALLGIMYYPSMTLLVVSKRNEHNGMNSLFTPNINGLISSKYCTISLCRDLITDMNPSIPKCAHSNPTRPPSMSRALASSPVYETQHRQRPTDLVETIFTLLAVFRWSPPGTFWITERD